MFRRPSVAGARVALAVLLTLATRPAAAQTAPASPAPASPESSADQAPKTPEEKIQELDQQLRILARQIELEKEAAAAAQASAAVPAAGGSGFELRSADGAFRVRFRGYLHADNRTYGDDDEARGIDTFLLRRARPIFEATTFRIFDFRIMPDFGNGTTVLQDAYVDARFSRRFNLRVGKAKAPFGHERLTSATDLIFIERALPTALAPNRDVGLYAYGDLTAWLAYQAGVVNGVIDGGSIDVDATDSKDVVGRVVVSPFRGTKQARLQSLSVAVAAGSGRELGTPAAPALAQYRSGGQLAWFRYRADATAAGTTIADGRRTRFTASGSYFAGPLGLQAEYVTARHDVRRAAATDRLEHQAWALTGTWALTGEAATGRSLVPRKAFDHAKGSWGAFEIAARVNGLTVDEDTFPIFASLDNAARSAKAAGIGLNWYLNRVVKISTDYELTRFDGGAVSGGDRADEHSILTRLQFAF